MNKTYIHSVILLLGMAYSATANGTVTHATKSAAKDSSVLSSTVSKDTLQAHGIEEIVVTGSNRAIPRRLLPYTVTVINNRQLEQTGKTQLLSAITGNVPSLFVSQRNILGFGVSNGGSGGIKIRGIGGSPTSGILMMVDGQPQFAGLFSHPVADFYETEYVDHVEILRGPGSVLYGSNAMGGVINVITKQASADGIHTTLTSQYGSYNTWQGRLSAMVSIGYDRTDGLQDHFDFKQKSLFTKVGYELSSHWKITADYSLVNFIGNDPIYAKLKDADYIIHQNVTRGETSMAVSNRYANIDGTVRAYYSYGNHYIDDPRHFHSLDDRFGILAYQNFAPWRTANATAGFDFNTYTGKIPVSGGSHSGNGTMQRKSITEYSPYVTLQQDFLDHLLTVNGGIRMANSDKFGTHWLPQLGLALHAGKGWNVRASLTKGYRNPSFRELYLYPPHNPDLSPERIVNYETTISKSVSRYLNIDLTGYFSEGTRLIQTVRGKNLNTGSFVNKGLEVSVQSHPLENMNIRSSYSYLHTSLDNLTGAPKNQYYLGVDWKAIPQLTLSADMKGTGSLYVDSSVKRESYVVASAHITYTPVKCLDVFVHLDNITDTQYTVNYGYTMPGFNVMGGVKLRL